MVYLRCQRAPVQIPIVSYHNDTEWHVLKRKYLTDTIHASVCRIRRTVGIRPEEVSTHSLCASIVMAILIGGIDSNVIQIIRKWKSETMLCYLHILVESLTRNHAGTILTGRHYNLLVPDLST